MASWLPSPDPITPRSVIVYIETFLALYFLGPLLHPQSSVDSRGPSIHRLRLRRTSDFVDTVLPELRRLCLSGLQIVRRERVVLTNVPLRTFGTNPRTSSQRQTAHSHFQARPLSVRRQHRVLSRSTACTCYSLLPPFLFHSFANRDVAD